MNENLLREISLKFVNSDGDLTVMGVYANILGFMLMLYGLISNIYFIIPMCMLIVLLFFAKYFSHKAESHLPELDIKEWNFEPLTEMSISEWVNYYEPRKLYYDIDLIKDGMSKTNHHLSLFYLYHINSTENKSTYQIHLGISNPLTGKLPPDRIVEIVRSSMFGCDIRYILNSEVGIDYTLIEITKNVP
jgi:hypothetical protein